VSGVAGRGAVPGARAESPWRRAALIAFAVGGLVVVARADALHAALLAVTEAAAPVMRAHPVVGAVVFLGVAALSAMLAFFSGAVLVPVAVQVWGAAGTIALLWGGWIVGGLAAYTIARVAGRPLVARLVTAEVLARYEARIPRRAPLALVVLFQLSVPSEVPGYVLGLARYPWSRYLVALAIGELPWAVLTVRLGTTLVAREPTRLLATGVVAAALGGVALLLLHRRLRSAS
jgi:uncharacterized membrane protein YdjX (TVP38/TMEM64 family)